MNREYSADIVNQIGKIIKLIGQSILLTRITQFSPIPSKYHTGDYIEFRGILLRQIESGIFC